MPLDVSASQGLFLCHHITGLFTTLVNFFPKVVRPLAPSPDPRRTCPLVFAHRMDRPLDLVKLGAVLPHVVPSLIPCVHQAPDEPSVIATKFGGTRPRPKWGCAHLVVDAYKKPSNPLDGLRVSLRPEGLFNFE